jgi:hypothetical protein
MMGDFSESSADILYTHIDFLRADIDYQMKDNCSLLKTLPMTLPFGNRYPRFSKG